MMERKFLSVDEPLQVLSINDMPVLACDSRVAPECIPAGLYMYEAGHDEHGYICRVQKFVCVDFWCTIISAEPFQMERFGDVEVFYPKRKDGIEQWETCTLAEYAALYESLKKAVVPYVEPPEYVDWKVTFADDTAESDFFNYLDECGIMYDAAVCTNGVLTLRVMWNEQDDFDDAVADNSGVTAYEEK